MVTTTFQNAALGHDRIAASVRLRTIAPISWMPGVGVCPSPVQLIAADALSARIDAVRVDSAVRGARFAEQPPTYPSVRLDKHDPGSTHLRPPV